MLFTIDKISGIVIASTPQHHVDEAHSLAPHQLLHEMGLDTEYAAAHKARAYWACLDYLGQMARWVEDGDSDDYELIPEFWAHLAQAAHLLGFADPLPFWIGKALQMPYRSDYEAMASMMVWAKIWQDLFDDAHRDTLYKLQDLSAEICSLHRDYAQLKQQDSFVRIAKKLEEGSTPMHTLKGKAVDLVQKEYFDILYPLLHILLSEKLPSHLMELMWPIVHRAEYGIHEE